MERKTQGILLGILVSFLWGMLPIATRPSYASADVLQTTTFVFVFMVITAFANLCLRKHILYKVTKKQMIAIASIAIFGAVIPDLIYYYALTKMQVVNVVMIAHMQPMFIAILGYFFLRKEKMSRYDMLAMICLLGAALLVSTGTPERLLSLHFGSFADGLMVIAAILWASAVIIAKRYLDGVDPAVIVFFRFGIGTIILSAMLASTTGIQNLNVWSALGGIITGGGYILYYRALDRITAVQMASLELLAPVFAAAFAYLLFGEALTSLQYLSLVLLGLGIVCISKTEKKIEGLEAQKS